MGVISVFDDKLLSLGEAARQLPGRPSPCTLWRWRARGVGGVRLKTILIGGRRFVSRQAIDEFVRALTAAGDRQPDRTGAEQLPHCCTAEDGSGKCAGRGDRRSTTTRDKLKAAKLI